MNYPTHDTDWATSARGNDWRRVNGKVLVVGKKKSGGYWAMVDGQFLPDNFPHKLAAMSAALQQLQTMDDWAQK